MNMSDESFIGAYKTPEGSVLENVCVCVCVSAHNQMRQERYLTPAYKVTPRRLSVCVFVCE